MLGEAGAVGGVRAGAGAHFQSRRWRATYGRYRVAERLQWRGCDRSGLLAVRSLRVVHRDGKYVLWSAGCSTVRAVCFVGCAW